jgi:hypothetical protein
VLEFGGVTSSFRSAGLSAVWDSVSIFTSRHDFTSVEGEELPRDLEISAPTECESMPAWRLGRECVNSRDIFVRDCVLLRFRRPQQVTRHPCNQFAQFQRF